MRLITFATLGFLTFTPAIHALDAKSDFIAAYKAYNEAFETGNIETLKDTAKAAYETGKVYYGEDHLTTAKLALNYSRQQYPSQKNFEILDKALNVYEREYGRSSEELIDVLMELGSATAEYHDRSESKKYHDRALDITKDVFGKDSYVYADLNLEIGMHLLTEVVSPYTLEYLEKAESIFTTLEGVEAEAKLAETNFWIGRYKLARNKDVAATERLLTSLDFYEKYAPNASLTLTNHAFLIQAYEKRGMRDEATKHCLAIGKATPMTEDQDYIPVYRVRPIYPASASRLNREGYSIISLTVDKDGFVQNPKAIETEGHPSFADAAINASKDFRYIPRFENGEPVETHNVRYKFTFALAN